MQLIAVLVDIYCQSLEDSGETEQYEKCMSNNEKLTAAIGFIVGDFETKKAIAEQWSLDIVIKEVEDDFKVAYNFSKEKTLVVWDYTKEGAIEAWEVTKNGAIVAKDAVKKGTKIAWNAT